MVVPSEVNIIQFVKVVSSSRAYRNKKKSNNVFERKQRKVNLYIRCVRNIEYIQQMANGGLFTYRTLYGGRPELYHREIYFDWSLYHHGMIRQRRHRLILFLLYLKLLS